MKIAVRYYSRSGNTKAVAEAIAEAVGVSAVSVEQKGAALTEPVDILFAESGRRKTGCCFLHLMDFKAFHCVDSERTARRRNSVF